MSLDASPLTVRIPYTIELVKGSAQTITAPLYRDGAAVAATAATCTIYNASNEAVTLASSTTVPGGVPTQAVAAADVADESYGDGWSVVWEVTHAGGTETSRHEAALVRSALYPVITDEDLYRRHRGLDASQPAGIRRSTRADYQDLIDEAWNILLHRLREQGRRAHLVMTPSALRSVHLALTLYLCFTDLATGGDPANLEIAEQHRRDYERLWANLSFEYDTDNDGRSNGRVAGMSSFWLLGRS